MSRRETIHCRILCDFQKLFTHTDCLEIRVVKCLTIVERWNGNIKAENKKPYLMLHYREMFNPLLKDTNLELSKTVTDATL